MKQQVDILYIGFVLGHGGDAIVMQEVATGVAQRGFRVQILVPELETSIRFVKLCQERGLPCERTPLIRVDAHSAKQDLRNLFSLFTGYRAPIVHFHTGGDCLPRTALMMMRLLHYPRAFVTVHSPNRFMTPGEPRARAWAKSAPQVFHRVICPSEHSRRSQIAYGVPSEKLCVIRNCIDTHRFSQGDPSFARRALGLPPETPLVMFTSRLDKQKCPLDAVAAFRTIAPDCPDAHLVFVGRGDMESDVRQAVAQAGLEHRVHFVGHQTNIPDWVAGSTVWYLPTQFETFSLSILEALAAGCPIVTTRCPGNDEILLNEENALLTDIGDVAAQALALKRLLKDSALRDRLRVAARQAAQPYSLSSMTERNLECYAQADARFAELAAIHPKLA